MTGTRYARLRSAELWLDYRAAIVAQLSIRGAADHCGISVPTARRWRRRIGAAPDPEIDGTSGRTAVPDKASHSDMGPASGMRDRGEIDFVEWARAATAIDGGHAMRERLDGLFGAASPHADAERGSDKKK